jgi:hypothetical protein
MRVKSEPRPLHQGVSGARPRAVTPRVPSPARPQRSHFARVSSAEDCDSWTADLRAAVTTVHRAQVHDVRHLARATRRRPGLTGPLLTCT